MDNWLKVKNPTARAVRREADDFRAKAKEMGMPSLATAALIAWEFVQRRVKCLCCQRGGG
jgi:hypothetical protein